MLLDALQKNVSRKVLPRSWSRLEHPVDTTVQNHQDQEHRLLFADLPGTVYALAVLRKLQDCHTMAVAERAVNGGGEYKHGCQTAEQKRARDQFPCQRY